MLRMSIKKCEQRLSF